MDPEPEKPPRKRKLNQSSCALAGCFCFFVSLMVGAHPHSSSFCSRKGNSSDTTTSQATKRQAVVRYKRAVHTLYMGTHTCIPFSENFRIKIRNNNFQQLSTLAVDKWLLLWSWGVSHYRALNIYHTYHALIPTCSQHQSTRHSTPRPSSELLLSIASEICFWLR